MVRKARALKYQVLKSELEALLIEAELIRIHQPEYNILQKDDKSPIYVWLTNDPYPQVKTVRKRDIYQKNLTGTILGPYQSGYKLKQVLRLARKIFTWCDEPPTQASTQAQSPAQPKGDPEQKPCFYYHLQLCPGACCGQISPQAYQQNIKNLTLFLKGQTKSVLTNLKQQMKQAANQLKFEQAGQLKQKIETIEHITSPRFKLKPDLILPNLQQDQAKNRLIHLKRILASYLPIPRQLEFKRIEGYDVSNIQGQAAAVSLVVFSQGKPAKNQYRLFNIKNLNQPNDYQMLKQAISRRQNHPEWGKPDLILVDGGKGQVRAALSVWQQSTPIIGLAKNPNFNQSDRIVIPTKHYQDPQTKRLKIEYQVLTLKKGHPALVLLEQIRDEAHRFAKKQHTRLRNRQLLE